MVLAIRKISFENEDLAGTGMLWFKDLNEPDPYLVLPILATALNYFNLGVSLLPLSLTSLLFLTAWNYERQRALVHQPVPLLLPSPPNLPLALHSLMASRCFPLLDRFQLLRSLTSDPVEKTLVLEHGQSSLLL
jgi:hypothetical protein